MKTLSILLAATTILFAGIALINFLRLDSKNHLIEDREKIITNYKNIIDAIGRTKSVDTQKLINELKKDFDVDESPRLYNEIREYGLFIAPKKDTIRKQEIWGAKDMELILDNKMRFKTVGQYKP